MNGAKVPGASHGPADDLKAVNIESIYGLLAVLTQGKSSICGRISRLAPLIERRNFIGFFRNFATLLFSGSSERILLE